MASVKENEREKIGVNDKEAKQRQLSLDYQEQQKLNQAAKQLFLRNQENSDSLQNKENTITEASQDQSYGKTEEKVDSNNKTDIAAKAGFAMMAEPALSGGILPATSISSANAVPMVSGLAPLFGLF